MPVGGLVSGGLGLVGGLVKGIIGGGQRRKAKKALDNLQYPEEQLPDEVVQNQNLAKQMAGTGLPSEVYENSQKNIQRQQLTAMKAARDRRGGIGALPGILGATNDAESNLEAQDAAARVRNQQQLMNTNSQTAAWKSKLFDANKRQKYIQDYNYYNGLLGAGNSNIMSGIDQGIAGIGQGVAGFFNPNRQQQNPQLI